MKLQSIVLGVALLASTAVFAATKQPKLVEGVTESTDPAKAAEVERHAQEIQAQQRSALNTSGTGSKKATKHTKAKKKKGSAAKSKPAQ